VRNHSIKFLYDTGSDITCISAEEFKKFQPTPKMDFTNPRGFKSAGGQPLDYIGTCQLPILIDGQTNCTKVHVINNLNEAGILGMDFISTFNLVLDTHTKEFFWGNEKKWHQGFITTKKATKLPPLSVSFIQTQLFSEFNNPIPKHENVISHICSPEHPLLTGGPDMLCVDSHNTTLKVINCSPFEIELNKGEQIGVIENLAGQQILPLDTDVINQKVLSVRKSAFIPLTTRIFIRENLNLSVPPEWKTKYIEVIENCHQVFSMDKADLGLSKTLQHDITLRTQEPIYVKQFKIPEAHHKVVEEHLREWLKLGIVEPCRSKYNSPLFVVPKKDGSLRIVQDFRALNAETHVDKYSMHDVSECVSQIGRAGSTIFSTLDLTSGFWQMLLKPDSRDYTAFTVPGHGQMRWRVAPMGLLGSPASFQRLVETAVKGIPNVIVYIDDLLIHTKTHEEHLKILRQIFDRLLEHNLKVNLKKCEFGSQNVSYLGFRLTPEGIKPGLDKLKAVAKTLPPSNVKEVRQFLGLCNFFRSHVKNFAIVSAPLAALTKKDSKWKRGPLSEEALTSFRELQSILCSEPVVDYPRSSREYALITDACLGDDKHPGGLGAILTQIDEKKEFRVIAYASRKLQKHEKNYTPFLLEMQAAIWGMEHFQVNLKGRHFILFTDHKPLENLGKVHTKTLNRLQEMMNVYDFEIIYKKGSEMPADFLSRNVVSAVHADSTRIIELQNSDETTATIKRFLINRIIPHSDHLQRLIKTHAPDCFVEDQILWKRIRQKGFPDRIVLFAPLGIHQDILKAAHGHILSGHNGLLKTKERILSCYYWIGMDSDISDHLATCHKCQLRKPAKPNPAAPLMSLPQCTEPNQRVHADLFGPLKTSNSGKKYILCITDAFTKYAELVALPDKEANTVSHAIFHRWICRHGSPLELVTDGGQEFVAKIATNLYSLMGIDHLTTSPRHPQCNSQAEVVNKTIAKYLASFVDSTTLDWELYLAPLMFSYNTSFHQSTRNTPYFLTFGIEPRAPHFPQPEQRRTFYGESTTDELYHRLQLARKIAVEANEVARQSYTYQHDKKVIPTKYHEGQLVLLDEYSYLHKNKKLAPQWSGPHTILRVLRDTNVELRLANNRKTIVHVNRLKPYHFPFFHDTSTAQRPPPPLHPPPPPPVTPPPTPPEMNDVIENANLHMRAPPQLVDDRFIPFQHENVIIKPLAVANDPKIRGKPKGVISKHGRDLPLPRPEPVYVQEPHYENLDILNQPFNNNDHPSVEAKQTLKPQVAPKDFFHSVSQLPQTEQRLTRSQARQILHLIRESDSEEEEDYPIHYQIHKVRRRRKKNGTSNDKLDQTRERNFKETGDDFGISLQVHHGGRPPSVHDEVESSDSSSSDDSGSESDGSNTASEDSELENEEHESEEERPNEPEIEIPARDKSPDRPNDDQLPKPDMLAVPQAGLPNVQQPRIEQLPRPQHKPQIAQPQPSARTIGTPMAKTHPSIPPDKRLPEHDKMQGGGKLQTPSIVPPPIVHTRGTQDVSNASGGAVPKNSTQKPIQTERKNPSTTKEITEPERKETESKKPSESDKEPSKTLPQESAMVEKNIIPPQFKQKIMELLGRAIGETSQAKRHEAYQKLHDALIIGPVSISLNDLPLQPGSDWITKSSQDVFKSAAYHRYHRHKKRLEVEAQTRTTSKSASTKTPAPPTTSSEGRATDNKSAQGRPTEQSRPTRSNTKAPDIPPTPSVPIERQSRREPPQ
jgi:Reverse transcriptase (RNA-dependent DNA polymerase)/RNase H-like domain found in reverse transcriptase/Integrase zinc binding domain/Integrase core domain